MKFQYRTEAEIGGVKFGLQVLSLNEEQKVQAVPSDDMDGMSFYSQMQKVMLSYSIRTIDGEEIPDVIEEDGPDGKKTSKERAVYVREVLDGLPNKITESLFEVYVDLREQKEKEINDSLSYSWYKTPEQREKEREERAKEMEEESSKSATTDEKGQQEAGATGADGIPDPDADLDFNKLPTDYSDVEAQPKV